GKAVEANGAQSLFDGCRSGPEANTRRRRQRRAFLRSGNGADGPLRRGTFENEKRFSVDDLFDFTRAKIEEASEGTWLGLDPPDMRNGSGEFDVAHPALTTTALANALMAAAAQFVARSVSGEPPAATAPGELRAEDGFAEQSPRERFPGAWVASCG